jgi:hypothetical protein
MLDAMTKTVIITTNKTVRPINKVIFDSMRVSISFLTRAEK